MLCQGIPLGVEENQLIKIPATLPKGSLRGIEVGLLLKNSKIAA